MRWWWESQARPELQPRPHSPSPVVQPKTVLAQKKVPCGLEAAQLKSEVLWILWVEKHLLRRPQARSTPLALEPNCFTTLETKGSRDGKLGPYVGKPLYFYIFTDPVLESETSRGTKLVRIESPISRVILCGELLRCFAQNTQDGDSGRRPLRHLHPPCAQGLYPSDIKTEPVLRALRAI